MITFERGPSVEACPRCRGAGRVYGDPSFRGVFAAMIAERGIFLDPDLRLLLEALNALDERVCRVESELARLV